MIERVCAPQTTLGAFAMHTSGSTRARTYQRVVTPARETADLIVEARRRADLSQSELAERTGPAQASIARWERGDAPSLETVREVVEACGLDLQTTLEERRLL